MDDTRYEPDDTTSTGDEQRVEQLAAEIDETRGDLTETISAIGDKLDPGNIAREATDTVRETTLGKVEQMSMGAQETWRDVRTGNAGSIVDTIKSNPVPAGMVGLGLAMLFMNRGQQAKGRQYAGDSQRWSYGSSLPGNYRSSGQSSWEPQRWEQQTGGSPMDRVGSAVSGAGDGVGQVAGQAGQTVGQLADEAGRRVGDVAEQVGQTAGDLPQQAGWYVEQGSSQVRRFIDENPLGAGVIAVAAGAAIGMLLPSTDLERQTIGQTRDQVIGQAESTVHQALDQVEQQAGQAQSSSQSQRQE